MYRFNIFLFCVSHNMSTSLATYIGISAILLWASVVALVKIVSTQLGPDLGVLLIYSTSTIILFFIFGVPKIHLIPFKFFILSTVLFVSYELCLSYSIALSTTSRQAVEVSVLNYLWPSFTIIALIISKELQFNAYILIGLIISVSGVVYIQTNGEGLNLDYLISSFSLNPLVYMLAICGAIIWALYCVITRKCKIKENPITLYFLAVTLILWIKFLISQSLPNINSLSFLSILYVTLSAFALGLGYAAWNIGMIHGNISILIACSYFTPIISCIVAVFLLDITLPTIFWHGVIAVSIGSLICWLATNNLYLKPRFRRFIRKLI